jgi:hypothetical protein
VLTFRAAQFGGSDQTINVLVDGSVVGTFTPGASYGTYQTSVFAPDQGEHRITFEAVGSNGSVAVTGAELMLLPQSPMGEDANGNPIVEHVPTQDELQRLQYLSVTESAIQSQQSSTGGDPMLALNPEQQVASAGGWMSSGTYPPGNPNPVLTGNQAAPWQVGGNLSGLNLLDGDAYMQPNLSPLQGGPTPFQFFAPPLVGSTVTVANCQALGGVATPTAGGGVTYSSPNAASPLLPNPGGNGGGGVVWSYTFNAQNVCTNWTLTSTQNTTSMSNVGPLVAAPMTTVTGQLLPNGGWAVAQAATQTAGSPQLFQSSEVLNSSGQIVQQTLPSSVSGGLLLTTTQWNTAGGELQYSFAFASGSQGAVSGQFAADFAVNSIADASSNAIIAATGGSLAGGIVAGVPAFGAALLTSFYLVQNLQGPQSQYTTYGTVAFNTYTNPQTQQTQLTGYTTMTLYTLPSQPAGSTQSVDLSQAVSYQVITRVANAPGSLPEDYGPDGEGTYLAWIDQTYTNSLNSAGQVVSTLTGVVSRYSDGTLTNAIPDTSPGNPGGMWLYTYPPGMGTTPTKQEMDSDGFPIGDPIPIAANDPNATPPVIQFASFTQQIQGNSGPDDDDYDDGPDTLTQQQQTQVAQQRTQAYMAQVAFDANAYESFVDGIVKGGVQGDLEAIAGGTDIAASLGLAGDSYTQIIGDAAWIQQVDQLASALQEGGVSGAFATAQVAASLIAHANGFNYAPNAINSGAALAWSRAAQGLGDLAILTAPGPGSLTKDLQDLQAGVSIVGLLSTGGAAKALGVVAGEIGAVVGIIEGFEQGGIEGGIEAGFSADMLTLLLEGVAASGGTATPIAIVVALVSAIFGGNHDNPADMPDKYDTQRYGQGVADLQGTAGANGQSFTENPSLRAEFGGRTGIQAIEETLAEYGTEANAPAWLQPIFDELEGMFGESATGSGGLLVGIDGGKDVNNQQIIGVPDLNGVEYQYTDLSNALYDFAARYAAAITSGQAAPFTQLSS